MVVTDLLYKNRAFLLSLLIIIITTGVFWSQSRIPALNQKAQMGDRINIDAIAFDQVFVVTPGQPLYERTLKSSINWAYTNWKGMGFGFLLAASFITLLQTLPRTRIIKNRFLSSLYGLVIGSPLGVCVNCATPIAQGMIRGGARLETSLALLLSSPTLNPIVIAIALSLLSFHMVMIKIALGIFFILLVIPLLVKISAVSQLSTDVQTKLEEYNRQITLHEKQPEAVDLNRDSLWQTLYLTFGSLLKNLIYIIKITLPLMILAGLLGSLLIQSLPQGSLAELPMSPLNLLIIALIGVILPVPIAFDVLIINILLNSGLDIGLAAGLLFSLGIFSIYPAMVIARTQSLNLSLLIVLSVVIFSMTAGYTTSLVDQKISQLAEASIEKELASPPASIRFDDIFKTCVQFDSATTKRDCLQQFLFEKNISYDTPDFCSLQQTENIQHKDSLAAMSICRQLTRFLNAQQQSIKLQSTEPCDALSSRNLSDECKVNLFKSRALEYTNLSVCSDLNSRSLQQYCVSSIIAERLKLKTPASCDLSLSDNMHRQCIDNLNAHITSELGEIEKCNALSSPNAQAICRSTVSSLKISRLQDYAICDRLTQAAEHRQCLNQVIMQQSLRQKNPAICYKLNTRQLVSHCRIQVAIRLSQSEIQRRNLAGFTTDSFNRIPFHPQPSQPLSAAPATPLHWSEIHNDGRVSVSYIAHNTRNITAGPVFARHPASQYGIHMPWQFNLTDFMEPFIYGKGIASGDFNNDGWPDLVLASSHGVMLYQNNSRGKFDFIANINLPDTPLNAFIVTLVDMDNDGWQDLYVSAYASDSIIFKNTQGHFSSDTFARVPRTDTIVNLAAAFADWDRDGDLDLAEGNWSYGAEGAFIPQKSQNVWYTNHALRFTPYLPDEPLGESLSLLLSDLNDDGHTDMLVANDRKYPDLLYLGNSSGDFSPIGADSQIIPETSLNSMSYDSADFNNDLLLDIFSTDMSVAAGDKENYCQFIRNRKDQAHCQWLLNSRKAVESIDTGWCTSLDTQQRSECFSAMAIQLAKRDRNNSLCSKIPSAFPAKQQLCHNISRKIHDIAYTGHIQQLQQKESNKLLLQSENHHFTDATQAMGVANSFWSWTGKAADLDNDEWQDIYIGNGLGFGQQDHNIHSNIFFHNQQGQSFKQAEKQFGLVNYSNTPSYTYLDYDLDGDIDIISTRVLAPPVVFENQATTNNSLSFVLRDHIGNRFCIGCKLVIYYGENNHQLREIKLSGGFMSFDDPVAYFGLSQHKRIHRVQIVWSDGQTWTLKKDLPVNRRYKITRFQDVTL